VRKLLALLAIGTISSSCYATVARTARPHLTSEPNSTNTAATKGDDIRVKAGYEAMRALKPDQAINHLIAPYIEAMRDPTPAGQARAARYLTLIALAFRYDDNILTYLSLAKTAHSLASDDKAITGFYLEALLRASELEQATQLVTEMEPYANSNSVLARAFGFYYRAIGEHEKADEYLRTASMLDPTSPVPVIYLAKSEPDKKKAAALYAKAATKYEDKSYEKEYCLWLEEKLLKGTGTADMTHLLNAERILPDDPNSKSGLAFAYLARGKTDQAEAKLMEAAQTRRFSLRALAQLSTYCAYNKKPKMAVTAADRAVQMAPYLSENYLARGYVHNALGNTKAAEADFKQAITISPHFNFAYEALRGLPEYQHGPKADKLAEDWLRNCPDKVHPMIVHADRLRKKELWKEAGQVYERALALTEKQRHAPEKKAMFLNRSMAGAGTCRYKLNDVAGAIKFAKRFNQEHPRQAGELIPVRLAKIDFSKIHEGSKQELAADHALLADMLYECHQLEDCIQEYNHAVAIHDDPEWHRGLLKAYLDKRDFSKAFNEDIVVSHNTVTKDLPGAMDKMRKHFKF
jgi:tetratricopeptide (TPR) repeat protein